MNNEEKILAKLDELSEEIQEAKRAIRPYVELKQEMEPLFSDFLQEAISKLGGLDRKFSIEELGELVGQLLVSSNNMAEALKMLNRMMEFKQDIAPYTKDMFNESVSLLSDTCHGFQPGDMKELLKQTVANMDNIAKSLKVLNSIMEFKTDAATLTKLAFNDIVERLEDLKQRGVFTAIETMLGTVERVGLKLSQTDFDKARPVKGVFGMMAALRRPEVQEGLGVLIELSTVMTAVKEQPTHL